jgi:general secretion pathway protein I
MTARGFTLVEVLVALVIVAAGAAAVLGALNTAAGSTTYLREKMYAQWIADNHLVETRLATTPPQNGKTTGELDYAGLHWQWRQTIEDSQLPGVRRVDVDVRPLPAGTPAAAAAVDDKTDWTFSVSGAIGRDLAPASGDQPDWEPATPQGGAAKTPATPTSAGTAPVQPTEPPAGTAPTGGPT